MREEGGGGVVVEDEDGKSASNLNRKPKWQRVEG